MASVIIVGGGVIGCATAYYLARAGADVTLLERGSVSSEASGAAAGILSSLSDHGEQPSFFHGLTRDSLNLFNELLPVLAETGIDVRHRTVGLLEPGVTRDEVEELKARFEKLDPASPASWLDGAEARAVEPGLSPKTLGAISTPGTRYLDPLRLTLAFAEAALRAGANIHEHEPVKRFLKRGDRLRGVQTAAATYEADDILITGGPWTAKLASQLEANVPVRPVRGQMLSLDGPPEALNHIVLGMRAFALPREDGQTYVGATVEDAGFRKHTTTAGLRDLRAGAVSIIPALAEARQRKAWAGLRPATSDALPVLGRLPGWRNAWVSAGHYRTGILLSPISGKLVAQAIASNSEDGLPAQLTPGRFGQTR